MLAPARYPPTILFSRVSTAVPTKMLAPQTGWITLTRAATTAMLTTSNALVDISGGSPPESGRSARLDGRTVMDIGPSVHRDEGTRAAPCDQGAALSLSGNSGPCESIVPAVLCNAVKVGLTNGQRLALAGT